MGKGGKWGGIWEGIKQLAHKKIALRSTQGSELFGL